MQRDAEKEVEDARKQLAESWADLAALEETTGSDSAGGSGSGERLAGQKRLRRFLPSQILLLPLLAWRRDFLIRNIREGADVEFRRRASGATDVGGAAALTISDDDEEETDRPAARPRPVAAFSDSEDEDDVPIGR